MICGIIQSIHDKDGNAINHDQWDEPTLHDGVKALFTTRTSAVDGISHTSAYYAPIGHRLTIYIMNNPEFETGESEARSLHILGISASSARRLCKLLGVDITL